MRGWDGGGDGGGLTCATATAAEEERAKRRNIRNKGEREESTGTRGERVWRAAVMENLPVYHGPISKVEGERRLGHDGREGSYLVRNSETVPGVFCLCVLAKGFVYTYRIHRDEAGSWAVETSPGVQKRFFRQIRNLIVAFQKPEQGLAMPLLYPVTAQSRAGARPEALGPGNGVPLTHGGGDGARLQQQTTQPPAAQPHKHRHKKGARQTVV